MQGCGTGAWTTPSVRRRARRRGLRLGLLGLLLVAGGAPAAVAQDLPPMVAGSGAGPGAPSAAAPALNLRQQGVPAEATAENGVVAREQALAAGRRLAWDRLVAEAGAPAIPLSDSQIENLVASIVIEQERPSPTRYSGRITVNFNGGRVRSQLAARAPNLAALGGGGSTIGSLPGPGPSGAPPAPAPAGPASNWLDAVATYRSIDEWLELRRRLRGAGAVATVEVLGVAVDAARLRIGLRLPPPNAAADLAGLGIALEPLGQPYYPGAPATPLPGQPWRVALAGGG